MSALRRHLLGSFLKHLRRLSETFRGPPSPLQGFYPTRWEIQAILSSALEARGLAPKSCFIPPSLPLLAQERSASNAHRRPGPDCSKTCKSHDGKDDLESMILQSAEMPRRWQDL